MQLAVAVITSLQVLQAGVAAMVELTAQEDKAFGWFHQAG